MAILEVKNISKSFDSLRVLKDISFNVEVGEVVAIIGPSGSGKSTLLRCINQLEKADGGEINVDGVNMFHTENGKAVYAPSKTLRDIRLKIASWLDESPENMREFLVLRKLYDISLWQANTDKTNSVKKVHYSIRKIMAEILKIAAIFLIGFWGSKQLQIQQSNKKQMQTIHVPAGQRAEVTLADGTHVWLNSRSTLKFPEQFSANTRNVELDGEGYFSVQHNENSPFTVHTQNHDVQVLGTEFNVKAYHNTSLFETALLKGSVKISSPNLRNGLQLKPNEIVSIENRMLKKSTINNSDYFKWKEGLFCFENESIQDIIKKLELYYDTTIEIQRPSLLKHHYSGKFRIQDGIEHVLKVLQLKHKFTYIKDDDKNLIIIK